MPAMLNLDPRHRSMATLREISLSCAGVGSTAGSRGSPTVSTRSRRSASSSWAAARGGATSTAVSTVAGVWRSAGEWPLPQTRWTRLYLHADRSLAVEPAGGSGAVDYAFDPHDPAPTVGGAISSGEP